MPCSCGSPACVFMVRESVSAWCYQCWVDVGSELALGNDCTAIRFIPVRVSDASELTEVR